MAEHELILNDANFIPVAELGTSNPENSNNSEGMMLNSTQNIAVSQDTVNLDEMQVTTKIEAKDPSSNNGNEENVESPTTGESYVYKCVFCDRVLTANDSPKLLECLHNSCGGCINSKLFENNDSVNKGIIQCAACHLSCEADKIIENQFLLESANSEDTAAKLAELKCSSCSDDIVATSWCVDCSEFICDICVQAHQRLKITKDHTIKPKEEGLQESNSLANILSPTNLFCYVHPHEKLSLFCENCDKLTCRDCQLTEHRDHKYKFTHEYASDARKYIGTMLKDVTYKRVLLNSAMKVIVDRQVLITDKKQSLVNEITQLVVKLTNTINIRGKQLIARLTEVCDSKQKTLQEKKEALEQLSKMTDHCIEFTQHALDSGSDMALLFSKRHVTNHLQRIKCKRADIPNPEIPVRIHLALEKVPELVKVISTIGQIVVDGRVYPAPATSPSTMLPPHGSPSPGHSRPPQQQSPIGAIQQPSPSVFQQPRMLPPYPQYPQNMHGVQQQQQQQSTAPDRHPTIAMSLAQHNNQQLAINFQRGGPHTQQRPPMQQRTLMPTLRNTLQAPGPGINHQQQVSSSTHPQGMIPERGSLRGLLQPNGNAVYVRTAPGQYQAVQPGYIQQMQNRYTNQQMQQQQYRTQMRPVQMQGQIRNLQPVRMNMQNAQGFQSPPIQQQSAKWHIPQQVNDGAGSSSMQYNNTNNRSSVLPSINDNFKITLKSQNHENKNLPATVTSTIPKTPSPNQGKESEQNLDEYCNASVKDLMATIAKLDSNGVQVLAEGRSKTGGSPHVDSSTDDSVAGPSKINKDETVDMGKDDPNEDWCAVCMDGGELVCCDKCPKVFHQFCHIPNLSVEESDTWQCLLCMNFAEMADESLNERKPGELSLRERKIVERLVLELYCQYELSLPFREVIGPEHTDYHSVIKKPVALDTIRQKLDWNSEERYRTTIDLVKDVRLMFKNAYTYNAADSQVYSDAKALEKFFDEQLIKFLPEYAYEIFDNDDDVQPPNKKYKRIISD